MKKILEFGCLFLLFGCATGKSLTQFNPYEAYTSDLKPIAKPEQVKVLKEQLPEGLKISAGTISAEPAYKGKYIVLGRVSVELKMGDRAPLLFIRPIYLDPQDEGGSNKYCKYNPLGYIVPLYNIALNPFAWPCYFQKDHSGEEPEDIQYRQSILEREMRAIASKMGANMIVGYTVGGQYTVAAGSGAVLSSSNAWLANGFLVRSEKQSF